MITILNNNQRVFQIVSSLGDQYFCNIQELNKVIKDNNLQAGYFTIYSFENIKPKKVHKTSLRILFMGAKIEQEFIY